MVNMSADELIAFEKEVEVIYLTGKIHGPVHLSGGNEHQLIEVFKDIKPTDWVFSTHRSHYHALLHGIDKHWVMNEIIAGRSIHLFNREHKFFTSAIVSGCVPIAMGTAMGIKMSGGDDHVWCFIGDMAFTTGIFNECEKYSSNFELPITFIIEDNKLSVNTPTLESWGNDYINDGILKPTVVESYRYKRTWPHIGCGKWVIFS